MTTIDELAAHDEHTNALAELPDSAHIILVAGMVRSGSTWLYNATRMLLSIKGCAGWAGWIDDLDPLQVKPGASTLIKLHNVHEALADCADLILASYRDVRDIAASARDMGWHDTTEKLQETALAARYSDEFWSERADFVVSYERIVGDPVATLIDLANVLGGPVSQREADELAVNLSRLATGATTYCRTTLLHPRHKTDGRPGRWRDTLEAEIAAAIEAQNRDWLIARGYLRP